MDFVEDGPHLYSLDQLGLEVERTDLLRRLANLFPGVSVGYLILDRGLSTATKVVLKPKGLFPFIVKIDSLAEIRAELAGGELMRLRLPPLSLAPLEASIEANTLGAIMHRYVTGGRIKDKISRLDIHLDRCSPETAQRIITETLDVILKKCHWLDGAFVLREVSLEDVRPEPGIDTTSWRRLSDKFDRLRNRLRGIRAPHAIVHGDLHAKNILIGRTGAPVLVDFRNAAADTCVYAS